MIYNSLRTLPYVYLGIHKETSEFYYGYRAVNKVPSDKDLGTKYFTSSKKVKKLGYDNFEWIIIAEFFDAEGAFWAEQELIKENIHDSKILNRQYVDKNTGNKAFRRLGPLTEDHKENLRKQRQANPRRSGMLGKNHTPEAKELMRLKSKIGIPRSEDVKLKISEANKGRKQSKEQIENRVKKNTGKTRTLETKAKMAESARLAHERRRKRKSIAVEDPS